MFPDLTRDDVFRIETRRLWLRWPTAKDAEAVLRLAGDLAVAEMTARIPHPLPRAEVDAFLLQARRGNAAGTGLTLALARRSAPADLIGIVAVSGGADGPELGYWLGRPHWGAGLMGEAVAAIRDAYFAYAGGDVLRASARLDNPASRRLLERSGFVRTATEARSFLTRGDDVTVDLFRLERARWLGASAIGPETAFAA
ncbi:GNAT family N-acetyltransferase [Methylobacterium radiodurans]|uniref:GNAT family N-acetyltransferase n=1 Tax=Methylobacterium radiodurans TaxID=2202828 RepID=A0A2U8VX80_9HYPH|nr:GNAT family N-acetyltransferase [Methylobacterium radiodurans]AWN38397.1 GNAT family N-acetyltransferase [Methylobacterium radiodurans]